jgi:hypothetical protein
VTVAWAGLSLLRPNFVPVLSDNHIRAYLMVQWAHQGSDLGRAD